MITALHYVDLYLSTWLASYYAVRSNSYFSDMFMKGTVVTANIGAGVPEQIYSGYHMVCCSPLLAV